MQRTKLLLFASAFGVLAMCGLVGAPVLAKDQSKAICTDASVPADAKKDVCAELGGDTHALDKPVANAINAMLFIIGILSVGMIIFGGITYASSAGDSSKLTTAKNAIMYAIIGLVVALTAFVIVNFVIDRLL
ncbi:MAG: pilin [Candidatus Nomurabacteria bacterium]|nr:pilin [Candidatus Nomurabacteria bacterium]